MPPRHGKSEFISKYFPAWFLGTFPDRRVILAGHEADFAMTWGRKVRDLLQEFGPSVFGVGVRRDSTAANRWTVDKHMGGMDTAGVGGSITGKGSDLLVIDDPIKNAKDANSKTFRDSLWDWYTSTAYTRIEPHGSVILVMTRWHADDLGGRIKLNETDLEPWVHLHLPAFAMPGDVLGRHEGAALWPERYNEKVLEDRRQILGSYWFSALFQGLPQPAEGGQFKRSWFRYWRREGDYIRLLGPDEGVSKLVRLADCRRFGIMDLAFSLKKSADYTAISAWAVTPDSDLILLDLHRDRIEGPGLVPAARRMVERHDLPYIGIEATAAQLAVVQSARRSGLTVRALRAETDKVSRAQIATVRCEAGQVYFPAQAPWLGDFETELLSFPTGAHDDMVDTLLYAAYDVHHRGGAPQPEEVVKAREQKALEAANEEWRRWDNPALWSQ